MWKALIAGGQVRGAGLWQELTWHALRKPHSNATSTPNALGKVARFTGDLLGNRR